MRWERVDELGGEVWALNDGNKRACAVRWIVYRVRGRRTNRAPSGDFWRGMRDGVVLRANQRVRSWLSRHAAMGAVEELARLGL